ncbi:hypothetical protein J6590_100332 [Homalodisca vitripennis]|nr:hypothetical protein J6590_100332 [Homalodisca vitripennis]
MKGKVRRAISPSIAANVWLQPTHITQLCVALVPSEQFACRDYISTLRHRLSRQVKLTLQPTRITQLCVALVPSE